MAKVVPVGGLRPLGNADRPNGWEVLDENARFKIDLRACGGTLEPGWYVLRGNMIADGGGCCPSSVIIRFERSSALAEVELLLPSTTRTGRIEALLLFLDSVVELTFCPAASPHVRLRDFSLRRVSRIVALRLMSGGGWLDRFRRVAAWARLARARGLKRATDVLYADYRAKMSSLGPDAYAIWVRKYDTIGPPRLAAFRHRAKVLAERPQSVTLVLWLNNEPEAQLQGCLDSVVAQVWRQWELLVCTGARPAPQVLADHLTRDQRVHIVASGCELTNRLAAASPGDFIVPLPVKGRLRRHSLLRVLERAAANPDLAVVYSDEDCIDRAGSRSQPAFKPDWNPDLLYSRNYLGHLVAIRAGLVRAAGGLAGGSDEDVFDLLLRCTERVTARQIGHVPEILYQVDAVAPLTIDPSESEACVRAVARHLERGGYAASVESLDAAAGLRRVRWHLPQPVPAVSLIIPTRDRVEWLRRCVESLLTKTAYLDFELLVVDNQSHDAAAQRYLRALATRERVRVLAFDAPFNYSAINNWAAAQSTAPLVGLVNNDIEVITPDWLGEMAGLAMRPGTGAVGALLYYPDDTIQHAGMLLGVNGIAGHPLAGKPRGCAGYMARARITQNLSAVSGACLLVRHQLFDAVGGLDEDLPVEFNDVDFCLRLQARGYHNVWTPFAELYHHESASRSLGTRGANDSRRAGSALMLARWGDLLRSDPAYNPNLSLYGNGFDLAFPPSHRAPGAPV